MPTIEFVEIAADNCQRAQEFYAKLFGWQFEKMDGPMEYYTACTADADGKPGTVVGMMPRQAPKHRVTPYTSVEDIEVAMKQVGEFGGQVVMPKQPVSGMGWFAVCVDTEQNAFALWQDDPIAG